MKWSASVQRGPALMLAATLLFTIMVGLVKVARAEMSAVELVFWRGLVSTPMALWLARDVGIRIVNRPLMGLRIVLGFGAMMGFFTAAYGLPVTTLSLITKVQPVLIAILAPIFLGAGEFLGSRARAALVLGLLGSVLIIGPELSMGSMYGVAALFGTLCSSGAHTTLRGLGRTDEPASVVVWFQIGILVLSGLWVLSLPEAEIPAAHLWPWIIGIGFCATAGQVLMTSAYRVARAAEVSAVSYTGPLMAVIGDVLFFTELPGPIAWFGGILVVGAGGLILYRAEPSPEPTPPPPQ